MIQLPSLFEVTLKQDPRLHSAVCETFERFDPWLEQSGMPFFPGFTDHSSRHITDVLQTAASLISDGSREVLTADDIAILCIATLLHDCGMHLTHDGFRALVSSKNTPIIKNFGDRPWHDLWADFLSEASRFSQEKLISIFGDTDPINVIQFDINNISERDCLLIGEFVRRHHARLAHEISITGVPSKSATRLEIFGLDDEQKDIAGLVARSHGMSIRSTFDYIQASYGLISEYRRIKIPFLMAALRIADYVQVQSERALKSLLSVKELRSPVSRQEWRNHFAVKDISTRHDDPEALYVHATPKDVKTYLRLVSLFKDIQQELDRTWATIGEVYGRISDLNVLGLSLRRIRSNLDDRKTFASVVPYIPIKAGFDTSGPELLRLLVGPLYNYSYKVGIRELIQNAVDACRERADLEVTVHGPDETASMTYAGEVSINFQELEDGTGRVLIHDNGVGMTLNTLTKYYLVAGASFRNSDIWKQQHLNQDGRSRVLRGGRFGVGALAAFLLGDEIKIRTRHARSGPNDGYEFTARMDDSAVEIRKCSSPVGTTIEVSISDIDVFRKLRPFNHNHSSETKEYPDTIQLNSWDSVDWFAQTSPYVKFEWDGFDRSPSPDIDTALSRRQKVKFAYALEPEKAAPNRGECKMGWRKIAQPEPYEEVAWRYDLSHTADNKQREFANAGRSYTIVNGIKIRPDTYDYDYYYEHRQAIHLDTAREAVISAPRFWVSRPSLSIFDPAGICPINLQRSSVSFDRMGLDERLVEHILQAYVSSFVQEIKQCETLLQFQEICNTLASTHAVNFTGQVSAILATKHGATLASVEEMRKLQIHSIYFLDLPDDAPDLPLDSLLKDGEALLLRQATRGVANDLAWFRALVSFDAHSALGYASSAGFPAAIPTCVRSVMSSATWSTVSSKGKVNRKILDTLSSRALGKARRFVSSETMLEHDEEFNKLINFLSQFSNIAQGTLWTAIDLLPSSEAISPLEYAWRYAFAKADVDTETPAES